MAIKIFLLLLTVSICLALASATYPRIKRQIGGPPAGPPPNPAPGPAAPAATTQRRPVCRRRNCNSFPMYCGCWFRDRNGCCQQCMPCQLFGDMMGFDMPDFPGFGFGFGFGM